MITNYTAELDQEEQWFEDYAKEFTQADPDERLAPSDINAKK